MMYITRLILPALLPVLLAACATGGKPVRADNAGPIENQLLAEIALERGDYTVAVAQYVNVALKSKDPEQAQRATELAWDYGFDAHLLSAAERWVKLDPDSRAARAYLGRAQVRFNRLDSAWENLELALGPGEERSDQAYALLAGDLSSSPRPALELFRRLDAAYPETPGITRSYAELAAQTGDIATAVDYARRTISLRSDWNATRVWLAYLLLADGQRSAAYEQLAFALDVDRSLEMELEFVRLLLTDEQLQQAADRLERISERYPSEQSVALTGAAILTQAGQLDEAAAIYLRLLEGGQCGGECRWHLGAIAYERRDYTAALEWFDGIGPGERLQSARLAVSQVYIAQDQPDIALQVLDDFARDFPRRQYALLLPRSAIFVATGRYDEAVATLRRALEYRPWSEALWLEYGGVLEQSGAIDKALDAFRTAWELAPDSATTQNAYGYTLTVATERYAEAEELIARALEQEPENPAIMDSMGWVLFKQGKRPQARVWLEKAYAIMPDPEIAAHLGELLWLAGEQDAARALLTEARAAHPDNRVLTETIERLLD